MQQSLQSNEVNEDGGINGYQVEFKFEDDENDAEKTLKCLQRIKRLGNERPGWYSYFHYLV